MRLVVHITELMEVSELNEEGDHHYIVQLTDSNFFLSEIAGGMMIRIGASHRPHFAVQEPLKKEEINFGKIIPGYMVTYSEFEAPFYRLNHEKK
jgi:hypothetical protein